MLIFKKNSTVFHQPFLVFLSLFYLCPIQSLLFSSFCWLWDLFVLLFLRSPNHSNQTRKRGRRYPDWRGRNGHATACRWHATMHRKRYSLAGKLLELITDSAKLQDARLMHSNLLLSYMLIISKLGEKAKDTDSFKITPHRIKWGVILTKGVKYLYSENDKTLVKEFEII